MKVLAGQSIAVRLAASAVFWSLFILLIAGLILALYRETTERAFDQRLLVYANDLASDLVAQDPADAEERDLGIGDPRFDIPLSSWYWEVGRPRAEPRDIRSSKSLLTGQLPRLVAEEENRRFGDIRRAMPRDRTTGPCASWNATSISARTAATSSAWQAPQTRSTRTCGASCSR